MNFTHKSNPVVAAKDSAKNLFSPLFTMRHFFSLFSVRTFAVWQRNLLVWRKMAITSMLGSLADPMIYLFGLGYGLGAMLPQMDGVSYISFLASGTIAASAMSVSSFEATYAAFSRLQMQRTWEAIIATPVTIDDVVAGELLWAATKATFSGTVFLGVIMLLGLSHSSLALFAIPAIFLTGICFAGLGLIFTSIAPAFDFFMYYFTLFITPMLLASGVFFPIQQLPSGLSIVVAQLPLAHAVAIIRPLVLGYVPPQWGVHVVALFITALLAFTIVTFLARRRLLS